jgi:hypothetical protein
LHLLFIPLNKIENFDDELLYRTPNRNIILLSYWKNEISKRLQQFEPSIYMLFDLPYYYRIRFYRKIIQSHSQ